MIGKKFPASEFIEAIVFDNPLYRKIYSDTIKKKTQKLIEAYPTVLDIETTNFCNSRCIICPHTKMKREKGIMKQTLFKKIADECIKNGIKTMNLNFMGEPFLDPHIFERIKYAKKVEISNVSTTTNASLLDESVSKKIIESGLDLITISLDGATKETYNKIRLGLDFDTVVSNINRFFEIKGELNSEKPLVRLCFVEIKKNEKEVKKYLDMWSKYTDDIRISTFDNWGGYINLDGVKSRKRARYACSEPFKRMLILWDGRVVLCCRDYDGFHIIGDVKKNTINEINNSEEIKRIRKIHLERKFDEIKLCSNCSKLNGSHTTWWY